MDSSNNSIHVSAMTISSPASIDITITSPTSTRPNKLLHKSYTQQKDLLLHVFSKDLYILKLYNWEPENYKESGLMDYAKIIQYMKRFLLDNAVIDPPPTSSYLALSTWSIQMEAIEAIAKIVRKQWSNG